MEIGHRLRATGRPPEPRPVGCGPMQRLSIEIDAVSARLFADAALDPKGYQLNVEQGRFHEREA